jgi:hypothetical protein
MAVWMLGRDPRCWEFENMCCGTDTGVFGLDYEEA